jgi:hypothetical protein
MAGLLGSPAAQPPALRGKPDPPKARFCRTFLSRAEGEDSNPRGAKSTPRGFLDRRIQRVLPANRHVRASCAPGCAPVGPEKASHRARVNESLSSRRGCPIQRAARLPLVVPSERVRLDGGHARIHGQAAAPPQSLPRVTLITWDEGDESHGNHVPRLIISPTRGRERAGRGAFDHYSLLRTTEQMLRLPCLGHACSARPLRSAFGL